MRIIKEKAKANFVPMDADEQTLYNILSQAFHPTHEEVDIPEAVSFSTIEPLNSDDGYEMSQTGGHFGDDGAFVEETFSGLHAEIMLTRLLNSFDDTGKLAILLQIARDSGYRLTHDDCARVLKMSRGGYMVLLGRIKKRSAKILQIPAK